MAQEKMTDALLGSAIKTIEELEALVVMIGSVNTEKQDSLSSKLREIASLFDRLPLLESDLNVIKRRLRSMLSSDPDKTPRAISVTDLQAVESEKRFEPVEEKERRHPTYRGIRVPLPKKDGK